MDQDNLVKSIVLSVFFATPLTARDLADRIGKVIGLQSVIGGSDFGPRYRWRLLGIELILFAEHGLVNDCGIDFEAFALEMDFVGSRTAPTVQHQNAVVRAFASFLAAGIAGELQCKTMVVENLQTKLEVYGV